MILLSINAASAENIDPDEVDAQYTWSDNIGWLNTEPDGQGGPGLTVSNGGITGYVWAENIGWISFSCENTNSCGIIHYGVTNNGVGNLDGYAWCENIGWISLSCDNTASCADVDYGVGINETTGQFFGYAWSENAGWISFQAVPMVHEGVITGWTSVSCAGDIEPDGDVDGADLVQLASDLSLMPLGVFADSFGNASCE